MMTNRMVSKVLASLIFGVMVGVMGFSTSNAENLIKYKCEKDQKCLGMVMEDKFCETSEPSCEGIEDHATFTRCKLTKNEIDNCEILKGGEHMCPGKCQNKVTKTCSFRIKACVYKETGGTN